MAILTKNMIIQAQDLKKEKVLCPEWGGDVYIRSLTGSEKEDFTASLFDYDEQGVPTRKADYLTNIKVGMLIRSICDEEGNRIFADEDAEELAGKNNIVLSRLDKVCNRLNGVNAEAVESSAKN